MTKDNHYITDVKTSKDGTTATCYSMASKLAWKAVASEVYEGWRTSKPVGEVAVEIVHLMLDMGWRPPESGCVLCRLNTVLGNDDEDDEAQDAEDADSDSGPPDTEP